MGNSVRGSGNVVTQTREVSGFDSIQVDYPARVLISQGSAETLKVEAEDNVLPGLKTEVKGKELRIYYKSSDGKHVNPTKMAVITITVKELTALNFSSAGESTVENLQSDDLSVSLTGAGNVRLNQIDVQNLDVHLSGAGSTTASGTGGDLNVNISGFGGFNGKDFKTNTAEINISGAGSATVAVDEKLDATISGAGSVTYYGSPQVTKHISGVGSVKQGGK